MKNITKSGATVMMKPDRCQKNLIDGRKKLSDTNKYYIKHFMGNVHVGESKERVTELIKTKIKNQDQCPNWMIKAAIRYALKCHQQNQKLYAYVTGPVG